MPEVLGIVSEVKIASRIGEIYLKQPVIPGSIDKRAGERVMVGKGVNLPIG